MNMPSPISRTPAETRPTVGYAFCGSFCTHKKSLAVLETLCRQYRVIPVFSETVYHTDTRFGTAKELQDAVTRLTNSAVLHTIAQTEPFGPKLPLDLLIIAPCTGNTLAKIAHGITDTAVTMAAKAQLRADRPVLIALATNDALTANLANIAAVRNRKNITLVPLAPDDPVNKPHSLVCDFTKIPQMASTLLSDTPQN